LVLIPRYGITGAAIATLFTEGLGTWVFPFLWEPLRESTWMMIKSSNPFYLYKLGREMIIE
jgi:O-antigen/teichoic acid export membrane protein